MSGLDPLNLHKIPLDKRLKLVEVLIQGLNEISVVDLVECTFQEYFEILSFLLVQFLVILKSFEDLNCQIASKAFAQCKENIQETEEILKEKGRKIHEKNYKGLDKLIQVLRSECRLILQFILSFEKLENLFFFDALMEISAYMENIQVLFSFPCNI